MIDILIKWYYSKHDIINLTSIPRVNSIYRFGNGLLRPVLSISGQDGKMETNPDKLEYILIRSVKGAQRRPLRYPKQRGIQTNRKDLHQSKITYMSKCQAIKHDKKLHRVCRVIGKKDIRKWIWEILSLKKIKCKISNIVFMIIRTTSLICQTLLES